MAKPSARSKAMRRTASFLFCRKLSSSILRSNAAIAPGFLNEGQVLLERLAKKSVARADLEKTISEALDGHLCRCTGYIKYHEAVRDVILADPDRYLSRA